MTWFTLDAFLRALYHETREGLASSMQSSLGVILKEAEDRMWAVASLPQAIAYRLPRYRKSMDFLFEITRELIANRQAGRGYPEDLLSRLVEGLSEEQQSLHDEVLAYILAGHDTTAHAISWSLYMLSRFPAERRLVEAEIGQVLDDSAMSMQHIKQLTYTRQVLDEVMRLYPPVWTMSREATGPDSIPLDDGSKLDFPAGAAVMMCQYAVHRRETYWPNPEAFEPWRFDAKAAAARPKYAWFPFGGGPRMCLGFRFAQVESVMALAMILQRYELSLIAGQHIEPDPIITLRPNGQVLYRVSHKTQQPRSSPMLLDMASTALAAAAGGCPFHSRQDNQAPPRKIPAA
jgi:cytochrome P450